VGHILEDAAEQEPDTLGEVDPDRVLYVVSQPILQRARRSPLASWRRSLFLALNRLSREPADALDLPRTRTVVIGRELDL
jgi:KUP system potassium uptake protein